jgi:hypothetical protein
LKKNIGCFIMCCLFFLNIYFPPPPPKFCQLFISLFTFFPQRSSLQKTGHQSLLSWTMVPQDDAISSLTGIIIFPYWHIDLKIYPFCFFLMKMPIICFSYYIFCRVRLSVFHYMHYTKYILWLSVCLQNLSRLLSGLTGLDS